MKKDAILDLIRKRVSWRSYSNIVVEPKKREQLINYAAGLETPFWGNDIRFDIIDVGNPGEGRVSGTYGMIKGAGTFLIGMVNDGYRNMEDFGYVFEKIILNATDIGLATCWIGLTIDRHFLSDKIKLMDTETIPAVSPLGYPAKRRSLVDTFTRTAIRASTRKPWDEIFFEESFGNPLQQSTAGDYELPLEMLRLAPSSTNKQPWRIVYDRGIFHFFLQRAMGYSKMTSAADLQRIDMGIAMSHFELTARARSLNGYWSEQDAPPMEELPKRCEYIVSWVVETF
jgi:nitroreductase